MLHFCYYFKACRWRAQVMWFRKTTKPRDQRGGSPPRGGAGRWQGCVCSGCSPVCFWGSEHESHCGLSEFEPASSSPATPPCRGSDQGRRTAAVARSLQVGDTSASLHAGSPRSHVTGQKIKFLYVECCNENSDRMSQKTRLQFTKSLVVCCRIPTGDNPQPMWRQFTKLCCFPCITFKNVLFLSYPIATFLFFKWF